jgi:hypothetical protein
MFNKVKEDDASSSPFFATLRENLFDFHFDGDFLFDILWKMKQRYREYLLEVQAHQGFIEFEHYKEKSILFIFKFKEFYLIFINFFSPFKEELGRLIQEVVTKQNVRKNMESLIEDQLLSKNDSWNVLIENARKNFDAEAPGRQFSFARTNRDLRRFQRLMTSNLSKVN